MTEPFDAIRTAAQEPEFAGVVRLDTPEGSWTEAFGLAHRGFEIANTPTTQFGTASGTKGFTALAIASLIEDGVLSLETTARSLLGEDLPLIDDAVTVEHLLSHTSGIGDYIDEDDPDLESTDYLMRSPVHQLDTTEAFLAELAGHEPKFAPGTDFSYCNSGFMVLALIAERASGTHFHNLIADRVLKPAGLHDTGFLRSDEPSGRMALGYLYPQGLQTNVLHLPVRGNGDGGIYTTGADMRAFWTAMFNGAIVSEEWVQRLVEPRNDVPDEGARYGLGFWLAGEGPEVRLVGEDAGVSFYSAHNPLTGVTATVLCNSADAAWDVASEVQDAMA